MTAGARARIGRLVACAAQMVWHSGTRDAAVNVCDGDTPGIGPARYGRTRLPHPPTGPATGDAPNGGCGSRGR